MQKIWLISKDYAQYLHASATSKFDGWLVFSALALVGLGWLMVSSASVAVGENLANNPQHYALRQSLFIFIGLGSALLAALIPTYWHQRLGHWYLLLAFLLLVLVLLVGKEVNGSKRWLSLGLFNLQTSEIAKIFFSLYIANYLTHNIDEIRQTLNGFIKPLILVFLYGVLLIVQPDYGSLVVIFAATMGMVFLAGARLSHFLLVLVAALIGLGFIAVLEPYRLVRLTSFTDPWSDQFDTGYQLTQALIAYGRGDWLGLGLGNSIQKLFYLPEAHTDFIFSVIAEELGMMGGLLILGLFSLLISRIFIIGYKNEVANKFFTAYFCYAFAFIFAAQLFVNLGVNTGLLPTKGLTLPLISYGGSSLLASGIMLGIIYRAEIELRE